MTDEERYYEQLAFEREQEESATNSLHAILDLFGPAFVLKTIADWLTQPLPRPSIEQEPF